MKSKVVIAATVLSSVFAFPTAAWAAVSFAPAVSYGTGVRPYSVAIGDLNGDNKPDVVTANFTPDNVSVLLGNGDGTYAAAANYGAGADPRSVAIGDLNADNKPDLAVANAGPNNVSVLLGNGDGTFAAPVGYGAGVGSSVAIGDLNADNKPDLAVTTLLSTTVSVLLGNGDGTFAAGTTYGTGGTPVSVAIGDLNGDGKRDIATANVNSDTVTVLLGNGDGTYAPGANHAVGDGPQSVAIGDLNADNKPDLAVANFTASNVSVLIGNGDGTYAAAANYAAGSNPRSAAIGDLNADGIPDLAVTNDSSHSASVLVNNGDGTFSAPVSHSTGVNPNWVAIGDLNADNKADLAVANFNSSSVSVLLNTTPSVFTTGPTATISGIVRQGQTLTADEGSPDPVPDLPFTYEWLADGVAIGGATAKTLLLTSAQVGKKISVTVTAKKAGYDDASDTSPETVPVVGIFTPGPTATISGFARIGSTLTAKAGSPSPTPTSLAYRWYADGVKLSQVNRTFKPTSSHHGKRITVRVYALKAGYLTASDLSPATARVSSLQAKTISMELNDYTVKRGQVVRAEIERLAPGEPFSIVLDGKKLTSGNANTKGVAVKYFTIPANATRGERILRAYGKFPDRTDPDKIIVR